MQGLKGGAHAVSTLVANRSSIRWNYGGDSREPLLHLCLHAPHSDVFPPCPLHVYFCSADGEHHPFKPLSTCRHACAKCPSPLLEGISQLQIAVTPITVLPNDPRHNALSADATVAARPSAPSASVLTATESLATRWIPQNSRPTWYGLLAWDLPIQHSRNLLTVQTAKMTSIIAIKTSGLHVKFSKILLCNLRNALHRLHYIFWFPENIYM